VLCITLSDPGGGTVTFRLVSAFAFAAALSSSLTTAQVPAGDPIVVTESGNLNSTAGDVAGDFVVLWTRQSDDPGRAYARRYDAGGQLMGSAFLVSTHTTGIQVDGRPHIALDADGGFLAVWSRTDAVTPNGTENGIFAQRHNSKEPMGSELALNVYTTGSQTQARVASDAAGNFTVVWRSDGRDGGLRSVYARRYDAHGILGPEVRVNDSTATENSSPDVASDRAGNLVVVWHSFDPAITETHVVGRRYDPSGAPVGSEFVISSDGAVPVVASAPDGRFVVAWVGQGSFQVMARLYDASGAPLGSEFAVAPDGSRDQTEPAVAMEASGAFVVAWRDDESGWPPIMSRVRAQRFEASGARRGSEFDVHDVDRYASRPSVTADRVGNFVVSVDRSAAGIAAYRFGGITNMRLDVDPAPSANSDGNGVLEPDETVEVRPSWRNVNGAPQTFDSIALRFIGPDAPGVAYDLLDKVGAYGTVPDGVTAPCSDCFRVGVTASQTRPATHWDATFEERLTPDTLGQTSPWPVHVGGSFDDVPVANPFYRFVETLLHHGVTGGCGTTTYCPAAEISRAEMAVFVLVAKEGAAYAPSGCGGILTFADVPREDPFCPWIEELARRQVVAGCGPGTFCPDAPVSREQMAVFVLKTHEPALVPPPCASPGTFADVPASSGFCPWVEELARRGVASGCGGGNYCPLASVTREQMSVFISGTFGLALYGL
jgi:S-layer family protein